MAIGDKAGLDAVQEIEKSALPELNKDLQALVDRIQAALHAETAAAANRLDAQIAAAANRLEQVVKDAAGELAQVAGGVVSGVQETIAGLDGWTVTIRLNKPASGGQA